MTSVVVMGLDHFKSFKDNFVGTHFEQLASPHVKLLAALSPDELFSQPHQLMYGPDVTLTRMMLDGVLTKVFHCSAKKPAMVEVIVNGTKCEMPYTYTNVHTEIDLGLIASGERNLLSEFVHKHLGSTKSVNVNQAKRIVVLHGIDDSTSLFALRKVLESCSNNVLFILTAKNVSKINDAIKSRCAFVRCAVSETQFDAFCQSFMAAHGIQEACVDRAEGITYTVLNFGQPEGEDGITRFINSHITALIDPQCALPAALTSNRAFSFKMLHFQVPIAMVFRAVIRICSSKHKKVFKNKLAHIVHTAANLEHKAERVSKPSLPIEKLLHELWMMTHTG